MAAEPVPVGDMVDSDGGGADTDGCSDIDVANMHDEDFLDEGEVGDMAEVVGAEDTKAFVVAGNIPASSSAAVPGQADGVVVAAGAQQPSVIDLGDEAALIGAIKTADMIQKAGLACMDLSEVAAQAQWTKNMSKNKLFELGLLMCEICLVLPAVDPKHPWCTCHKSAVERAEKSSRKLDKVISGSKTAFASVRKSKGKAGFRVFMVYFINRTAKWDSDTQSFLKVDYCWAQLVRIKSHMTAYLVALM